VEDADEIECGDPHHTPPPEDHRPAGGATGSMSSWLSSKSQPHRVHRVDVAPSKLEYRKMRNRTVVTAEGRQVGHLSCSGFCMEHTVSCQVDLFVYQICWGVACYTSSSIVYVSRGGGGATRGSDSLCLNQVKRVPNRSITKEQL